jgi:hypothetical protein
LFVGGIKIERIPDADSVKGIEKILGNFYHSASK